jgi:16S rRNA (cytosine1402-N4)-methyltransferase
MSHIPVLLDQVLKYLAPKDNGVYVDCTFGNGGYSKAILEYCNTSKVIAIDQDPSVLGMASDFAAKYDTRFTFIKGNFSNLAEILNPFGLVDGIVWDLGVSSMQLDNPERGFSFSKSASLDMRMSQEGFSAYDFINSASEEEIANVIFYNGGETKSRQIAKKIVELRNIEPIQTTTQLAGIVKNIVYSRNFSIDPATKTFQAIRIFVNKELEAFDNSLKEVDTLLRDNGRIVCVSFHSLEDIIIKNYLKTHSAKKVARSKYHKAEKTEGIYEILTHKPVIASNEEIKANPRSRSAKLRAAKKIN